MTTNQHIEELMMVSEHSHDAFVVPPESQNSTFAESQPKYSQRVRIFVPTFGIGLKLS